MMSTKDDVCISCFENFQDIRRFDGGLVNPYLLNGENKNLAVDGSTEPVTYEYLPPEGLEFYLCIMSIYMDEGGSFTGNGFASESTPLARGIEIFANNNLMINVKANKDLETWFTYQNPLVGSVAAPPTRLIGYHNFLNITNGLPIIIDQYGVKAIVSDDIEITGLDIHIMLSGYLRKKEIE